MRLRSFLLSLAVLLSLLPGMPVIAQGTTPTEAAAIAVANSDHAAYTLPAGKLAAAKSLKTSGMVLLFVGILWPILILWFLLQSGTAARMRNVANNLSKNRWIQGFVFSFELLFMFTLLELPLTIYEHHRLMVYGLSVQGFGSWFHDQFLSFILMWLFGGLGVMLLFLFIMKFPRRWWIPSWAALCLLTVLGFFATPYVIDPLFNHFEPLSQSNPALVAQLERVVARGNEINIPPERMFLMKASNKTTQLNAYVTGIGASKRIVVWDTSIAKGTPDEITFIFGHEMGHYVLGHILAGMLWTFALSLVGFFAAFYLFHALLRRFGKQWRVPAQQNWAALVVMLLAISLVYLVIEPIQDNLIRINEHAADVYGEEVVHGIVANPQAVGQGSFQLLGEASLSAPDPAPWYVLLTFTHPAVGFRAAFAKAYDPWAAGQAPKYIKK